MDSEVIEQIQQKLGEWYVQQLESTQPQGAGAEGEALPETRTTTVVTGQVELGPVCERKGEIYVFRHTGRYFSYDLKNDKLMWLADFTIIMTDVFLDINEKKSVTKLRCTFVNGEKHDFLIESKVLVRNESTKILEQIGLKKSLNFDSLLPWVLVDLIRFYSKNTVTEKIFSSTIGYNQYNHRPVYVLSDGAIADTEESRQIIAIPDVIGGGNRYETPYLSMSTRAGISQKSLECLQMLNDIFMPHDEMARQI